MTDVVLAESKHFKHPESGVGSINRVPIRCDFLQYR